MRQQVRGREVPQQAQAALHREQEGPARVCQAQVSQYAVRGFFPPASVAAVFRRPTQLQIGWAALLADLRPPTFPPVTMPCLRVPSLTTYSRP